MNRCFVIFRIDLDMDRSAGGAELCCVVEDVEKYLRDTRQVGVQIDRFVRQSDSQLVARLLDLFLARFDRHFDRLAKLKSFLLQVDLSLGNSRYVEQVVDQPDDVIRLTLDHVEHLSRNRRIVICRTDNF